MTSASNELNSSAAAVSDSYGMYTLINNSLYVLSHTRIQQIRKKLVPRYLHATVWRTAATIGTTTYYDILIETTRTMRNMSVTQIAQDM